jgi:L-amino acid N-acyltransferase YncA
VIEIRAFTAEDWPAIEAIYAEGIAARQATFETATPTWAEFDAGKLTSHRVVATDGERVLGWAALSSTSERTCYSGVVENSVYVAEAARGSGVGRALMDALIAGARAAGFWTIETGIFPENEASVALHESLGFRVVGRRERIAELDGRWRDTILLELRL